jgi:hypothetical protein
MTIEDRVRDATRAEADRVEVDPEAWTRIQAGVGRRRRTQRRRTALVAAAVALVVGGGLAVAVHARGDDSGVVRAGPGPTTDTAPSTATTVPGPVAEIYADPRGTGVWPFTDHNQVLAYVTDPGDRTFYAPDKTALAFAKQYLHMPDPYIVGSGVSRPFGATGAVVRPSHDSKVQTRISLLNLGADGPFTVTGATTDDIVVDRPQPGTLVTTPVKVSGRSVAFEAAIAVEVRLAGQLSGESTTLLGGSTQLGPFAGEIPYNASGGGPGAVVFYVRSAKDGSVVEAAVVPVLFPADTRPLPSP